MKKHFFPILTAFLVSAFSASAAFAVNPACDPQVWQQQQNQSNAMQIRDAAVARQITKQPDSTLGLTCFDQSMAVTAQLGSIFSDVAPASTPSINTSIFTGPISPLVSAVTGGAGGSAMTNTLGQSLKTVIAPVLNQELSNFPDALSAAMGALQSLFNTSGLSSQITSMFGNILGTSLAGILGGTGTAAPAAVQPNCQRMETLWGGNNAPGSGVTSIQGSGPTAGVPYATIQDLFSGAPAGASSSFLGALTNSTNSAVLQSALSDLTTMNAPGGMPSWPAAPQLSPDMSTAQIIGGM